MRAWCVISVAALAASGCGGSSSGNDSAVMSSGGSSSGAGAGGATAQAGSSGAAGEQTSGGSAGSSGGGGSSGAAGSAYDAPGSFPVGHTTFVIDDATRGRMLPVEIWYPADESGRAAATTGTALEDMEAPGPHHDALAPLVAAAPVPCTRKRTASAADVTPASGMFPLIAFSHCSGCMRYSSAYLAERLASHGFAVVAPDHVGNTLWDQMAGTNATVSQDFLATRAADIEFTVTSVLDVNSTSVPASLVGRFDPSKVAMFGHSFGGLTTGVVVQEDTRFLAGLAIASPLQLYPPTDLTMIHVPLFFFLASEDHSIGAAGNNLIRDDFMNANPPAELAEVADAGHWSFSDIAGLTSDFAPGCGMSTRQSSPHAPFTYIDNDEARGIAASYIAAFFALHLRGDMAAASYLAAADPSAVVTITTR